MSFHALIIHTRNSLWSCFITPVLHLHCSTAAYLWMPGRIAMNDMKFVLIVAHLNTLATTLSGIIILSASSKTASRARCYKYANKPRARASGVLRWRWCVCYFSRGDEVRARARAQSFLKRRTAVCMSLAESSCFVPRGACNVPIYAGRGVTLLTVCASSRSRTH